MPIDRKSHILGSLAVLVTLLISSVSACACDHHGTRVARAKPSCHSAASHEDPVKVEVTTDNTRIEKSCNCNIHISPASVLTRSEKKGVVLQQDAAAADVILPSRETSNTVSSPESCFLDNDLDLYETLAHSRAPSRAPPRL